MTRIDTIATWHELVHRRSADGLDALLSDDVKVMVRPLKAVNLLHAQMRAMLEAMK